MKDDAGYLTPEKYKALWEWEGPIKFQPLIGWKGWAIVFVRKSKDGSA